MGEDYDRESPLLSRIEWVDIRAQRVVGVSMIAQFSLLVYCMIKFFPGSHPSPRTILMFGNHFPVNVSPEVQLLILVLCSAGLGGLATAASSFVQVAGSRAFRRQWMWWYVLQVFIASALGLISYLAFRTAFFSPDVPVSSVNTYGVASVAGLVGLFSRQALDQLSSVFTVLFKVSPTSSTLGEQLLSKGLSETVGSFVVGAVLDNYEGFVCVSVEVENRSSQMEAQRVFGKLRVWFQNEPPQGADSKKISIRDGRDSSSVIFEVAIDSSNFAVRPRRDSVVMLTATSTRSAPIGFSFEGQSSPPEGPSLWVEVFQKNRLIEVVPITLVSQVNA